MIVGGWNIIPGLGARAVRPLAGSGRTGLLVLSVEAPDIDDREFEADKFRPG